MKIDVTDININPTHRIIYDIQIIEITYTIKEDPACVYGRILEDGHEVDIVTGDVVQSNDA